MLPFPSNLSYNLNRIYLYSVQDIYSAPPNWSAIELFSFQDRPFVGFSAFLACILHLQNYSSPSCSALHRYHYLLSANMVKSFFLFHLTMDTLVVYLIVATANFMVNSHYPSYDLCRAYFISVPLQIQRRSLLPPQQTIPCPGLLVTFSHLHLYR